MPYSKLMNLSIFIIFCVFQQTPDRILTWSDAVDVVADFAVAASLEVAMLIFHELLEAVLGQQLILLVVCFVLLCKIKS